MDCYPLLHFLHLLLVLLLLPSRASTAKVRAEQNVCQKQVPNSSQANQSVTPLELFNRLCFEIALPYETIVLPDNVPGFNFSTSDEVVTYMNRWRNAKLLPRCWPYLQVALCSILMPRYHEEHSSKTIHVHRPNVEICNDVVHKSNCQFIERHFGWPRIFKCNDTSLYARNCSNEMREYRPQAANACLYPLVASDDTSTWFKDVRGCSMTCKQPVFNPIEQRNLSVLVKLLSLLGLLVTSVAILLFEANHNISRTSQIAIVIKKCNIYKFFEYLGWSLQLVGETACNQNGAALSGLPLVANACVLSFALTYISSTLFLFWFVYLAKLCYLKLVGKNRESPESKMDESFNLVSYVAAAVLFISVSSLAQIDGHGLYGVCVVGSQSIYIKILFDFMPTIVGVLYSNFYFLTTIVRLTPVEKSPRVGRNYSRIIALASISTMDMILKVGIYFYNLANQEEWERSVESYLACNLDLRPLYDFDAEVVQPYECSLNARPLTILYYFEVVTRLTSGLVIASWAFCGHNFRGFLRKLFDHLENDKEKQKRIMRYINANETYAENGYIRPEEIHETIHDLVDMTSATKTHPNKNKNHIELDNNNAIGRFRSIEIPSSLGSVSLSDVSATSRQPRRRASLNCPTSRDVVNDVRRIQATGEQPKTGQQVNSDPLSELALLQMFSLCQQDPAQMLASFANHLPPNTALYSGPKSSVDSELNLEYRMCEMIEGSK